MKTKTKKKSFMNRHY